MTRENLTREQLCYEVWVGEPMIHKLVGSYWDALDAWNVAEGIRTAGDVEVEVNIIVANGMQANLAGVRSLRSDVIPRRA